MIKRISAWLLTVGLLLLCSCGTTTKGQSSDISVSASASNAVQSASSVPEASPVSGMFRVYCFSAGKADALLLYTDAGSVLIDTGVSGFGDDILAELDRRGISSLDYLIVTHFDQDHVGGAAKVLKNISVGRVLQSDYPRSSDEYEKYVAALEKAGLTPVTVQETMTFTLDGAEYTVYPPEQTDYEEKPSNNSSLIVSVTYGARRFLFTGDAQDARIQEFLSLDTGSYDFLKVPYHGFAQSSLPALFAAVDPSYAVITSSDEQRESTETVQELEGLGSEVFLTRTGPVLAECDGTDLQVEYVS